MTPAELIERIGAALGRSPDAAPPPLPTTLPRPAVPAGELPAIFIAAAGRAGAEIGPAPPASPAASPFALPYAVVRASLAIALSGTVVIDDGDPLATMAAPILYVQLDPCHIVPTLADALQALAMRPTPASRVFITGPSKTADIEGILITGVHGPGKVVIGLETLEGLEGA